MAHPIIPQLIELATPIAQDLGLEVVAVRFQTNQSPPVLRIDIRNPQANTGLQDCEQMSRSLDEPLEQSGLLGEAYVLEVSSPGAARQLTSDREFIAFKGFAVLVKTYAPFNGKKEWQGTLQGRDEESVHLSQKGKAIAIPRTQVANVHLWDTP